MAVGYLETVTTSFSKHALVYTGLTGDPFLPSAVESSGAGRFRRKFKTERTSTRLSHDHQHLMHVLAQLTMLTYTPLTLTFPFALMTYLFVAHTLNAPNSALGAALLGGGVTALVGLFGVSWRIRKSCLLSLRRVDNDHALAQMSCISATTLTRTRARNGGKKSSRR